MIYKTKQDALRALPTYKDLLVDDYDYLQDIDERLSVYCFDVLDHYDDHNFYEILGVFRFLNFIDKYGFDVSRFRKFVNLYEQLRFPSDNGPSSFELTPVQVFQFANIYGFVDDDGLRICREACLFVPRKYSKSTSVAACAIHDMLLGDSNAQSYIAANTFKQAKICYDIIDQTVKQFDPKMASFRRNREMIYSVLPSRSSFIQCLTSSPDRLDGLNASVAICDEFAAAKSAALKNVLTSSMGARREPLTIIITTASTNLDGPFMTVDLPNYQKILRGEIEDDSVFASLFMPDEGDEPGDPHTWAKVQPHLGVTVKPAFYKQAWKKAQRSPEDHIEFLTKLVNIPAKPLQQVWIERQAVERNMVALDIKSLRGRPICFVSVDLSVRDDMSSVTYLMYDSIKKTFAEKTFFYAPKATIEKHVNSEMYGRWRDAGYLIECGTDTIDYEQIGRDIIENGRYLNILNIAYDAYKSLALVNYLKAMGIKCLTPYKQTYVMFSAPVEELESMVYKDQIKFDENPIMLWEFGNVAIDEDSMSNRKPVKGNGANGKIDGIITLCMCIGTAMNWKR